MGAAGLSDEAGAGTTVTLSFPPERVRSEPVAAH